MYNDAPKVLFAGEATTNEYFSAVHGAMHSADREVDRLTDYVTCKKKSRDQSCGENFLDVDCS